MKTSIITYLYIVILLCFSCSGENEKTAFQNETKEIIPYIINREIINYANKLNLKDTLNITFNLSACTSIKYSHLRIIKIKNNIELEVTNTGDYSDTSFTRLYNLSDFNLDSILTTELINNLTVNKPLSFNRRGPFFDCLISYKQDSIFLQDTPELISKIMFINKFNSIMKKEFPNTSIFNQLPKLIQTVTTNKE